MTGSSLGPVLLAGLGPVIFLFLIFLALFSGAGGWILWRPPVLCTDQFGPTRPYVDNTIIDITVESNSVETTGYLNGTIGGPGFNYSTEFGTPFIRDYSPNGRVLWTSMITDIPGFLPFSISAGPDRTYLAGSASQNTTLLKYDFNGTRLWSKDTLPWSHAALGGPEALSEDNSGVYVSGTISRGNYSPRNGFVSKYDFDGNMIWTEGFSSPDQTSVISALLWADPSGIYVSYESEVTSKGYVAKYDSNHNQAWNFETPISPLGPFQVAYTAGELFLAGTVSQNAFVQAFSGSPSLILFGLNPPISFVFLGSLLTGIGVCVYFLARRYSRRISKRPRSASPVRYRNTYRNPNPRA